MDTSMGTYVEVTSSILGIFALIGIVGNIIVIWLWKHSPKFPIQSEFIQCLSIVDLMVCAIVIPFTIAMEITNFVVYYDILCKLYHFMVCALSTEATFLMVGIAVERYVCICGNKKNLQKSHTRKALLFLTIIATLIGILNSLLFGISSISEISTLTIDNMSSIMQVNTTMEPEVGDNYLRILESFANWMHNSEAENSSVGMETLLQINTTIDPEVGDNHKKILENFAKWMYNSAAEHHSAGTDIDGVIVSCNQCRQALTILDKDFQQIFQPLYASVFLLCLLMAVLVYGAILKYIIKKRKHFQRSTSNPSLRRRTLHKNARTALMMAIVTGTFIFSFLPAWLMKLRIVPINIIVFNSYFAFHVLNPFIYVFMTENVRRHLSSVSIFRA